VLTKGVVGFDALIWTRVVNPAGWMGGGNTQ